MLLQQFPIYIFLDIFLQLSVKKRNIIIQMSVLKYTSTAWLLYQHCAESRKDSHSIQPLPIYLMFFLTALKMLCTIGETICYVKWLICHQFLHYINAGPNLGKITDDLSMFAFALIAKKYWNVIRLYCCSLDTTRHCWYGRTWNIFFWVPLLFSSCFHWRFCRWQFPLAIVKNTLVSPVHAPIL